MKETALSNLEYGDVFKFKNRGRNDPSGSEYFELTPEGIIDLKTGHRYSLGSNYTINASYYRKVLVDPDIKRGALTNKYYAEKESLRHAWFEFYKVLKDEGAFCGYPTKEKFKEYGKCDYSFSVKIHIGKKVKDFSFNSSSLFFEDFRVAFLRDKIYDPEYYTPIVALIRYFVKHD